MKKVMIGLALLAFGLGNLKAQESVSYRDYTLKHQGDLWQVYEDDWPLPVELKSQEEARQFVDWLEHGNC